MFVNKRLFEINEALSQLVVTLTLINIYYFYMEARFYKYNEEEMD